MLESAELIAFVGVTNARRARAFYEGKLGLKLVEENSFAMIFNANGVMLRVTKVGKMKPAAYTVLGWKVGHIRETIKALKKKGVGFERYQGMEQDELGVWRSPSGGQVAWFKDPDGNVLSLTEF